MIEQLTLVQTHKIIGSYNLSGAIGQGIKSLYDNNFTCQVRTTIDITFERPLPVHEVIKNFIIQIHEKRRANYKRNGTQSP